MVLESSALGPGSRSVAGRVAKYSPEAISSLHKAAHVAPLAWEPC